MDDKYRNLYDAINEMMAPLGTHGMIYAKDDRVTAVMDALHDIDGGVPLPQSSECKHGESLEGCCNACADSGNDPRNGHYIGLDRNKTS